MGYSPGLDRAIARNAFNFAECHIDNIYLAVLAEQTDLMRQIAALPYNITPQAVNASCNSGASHALSKQLAWRRDTCAIPDFVIDGGKLEGCTGGYECVALSCVFH